MQRRAPSWSTLALAPSNLNTSHPVQIFAGALACLKEEKKDRIPMDSISEGSLESPAVPHSGVPNSLLSCYRSVSELK